MQPEAAAAAAAAETAAPVPPEAAEAAAAAAAVGREGCRRVIKRRQATAGCTAGAMPIID